MKLAQTIGAVAIAGAAAPCHGACALKVGKRMRIRSGSKSTNIHLKLFGSAPGVYQFLWRAWIRSQKRQQGSPKALSKRKPNHGPGIYSKWSCSGVFFEHIKCAHAIRRRMLFLQGGSMMEDCNARWLQDCLKHPTQLQNCTS